MIDYENVGLEAIQRLLDELSNEGRVIIRRAYGDWSVPVQRGKQDQLLELGLEPIHQYHSNRSGKNSADIRLAIEAIDLLHTSPVDTFVIVSSDSDFVPLVSKLRQSGKSVIVAGRREATSPTLIKSCDRYIFLDDAEKQNGAPVLQMRRGPRRRGGPPEPKPAAPSAPAAPDPKSLLRRAMNASMDVNGNVVGSKLYQTMRRMEPSFDYKDHKHRLFTQFLDAHDDLVDVSRPEDGVGDVVVHLKGVRGQPNRALATPAREGRGPRRPQAASDDEPETAARNGRASRRPQATATDDEPDAPPLMPRRRASGRGKLLGSTRSSRSRQRQATSDADAPAAPSTPEPMQPVAMDEPEPQMDELQAVDEQPQAAPEPTPSDSGQQQGVTINWEREVDAAWARRDADRIFGRAAAIDAAKVLGATKLSASPYPSLEALISASTLLQLNWRREGNAIIRK